ncbi:seryl-tRNA synthetase, mitochondrial [Anticarsia gemmatalis]|uniref:seryl-tRNA synthetase, mitochondrial n=1 Tax=Anticarsia gemmatalis TaxID=129554 RepID=UPI003F76589B
MMKPFLKYVIGVIPKIKCKRPYSSTCMPEFDIHYYCNPKNAPEIENNIKIRKGVGDLGRVLDMYKVFKVTIPSNDLYPSVKNDFFKEISLLPNKTHPAVINNDDVQVMHEINKKRDFSDHKPLEFSEITRRMNLVRTDKLGNTCGHKSYYFLSELAELEEALIKYTVRKLVDSNFQFVSVPDILPSTVLENCGMSINTDRTQIYCLDSVHHGPDLCLSGTAEMSLAGLLMNSHHHAKDLPMKLAAVSRCYRAETSNVIEERGIYRVHQFTKVEMFIATTSDQSENMLEYIRKTQEDLFTPLGFNMRVLDMPPHELGAPAYRKYDIEAWMPGRNNYGEISSCSNCTDYQSRRLNIKYTDGEETSYVHTLNGTACAVPRMLIALLETHQDPKGKIFIPEVLQPYINGKKYITKNNLVPELKLLKVKR